MNYRISKICDCQSLGLGSNTISLMAPMLFNFKMMKSIQLSKCERAPPFMASHAPKFAITPMGSKTSSHNCKVGLAAGIVG